MKGNILHNSTVIQNKWIVMWFTAEELCQKFSLNQTENNESPCWFKCVWNDVLRINNNNGIQNEELSHQCYREWFVVYLKLIYYLGEFEPSLIGTHRRIFNGDSLYFHYRKFQKTLHKAPLKRSSAALWRQQLLKKDMLICQKRFR